jgi:hypothetical protein
MNFNAHNWTAVSILVMVAVIVFMDWIPTPLNRNIQGMSVRERLPSTIIHTVLGVGFAISNILMLKWIIFVGAIWFSLILLAAIRNWWIAYFAGRYLGEITPEIYSQHYAQNLTILPRFKDNPVIPDVQHMFIHFTVLLASLLSWWSFWLA